MSKKREAAGRYHINHSWSTAGGDGHDAHTCRRCGLVVLTTIGTHVTKAYNRIVSGRPYPNNAALPACSSLRGATGATSRVERENTTAAREVRDMIKLCGDVCGKQRVKDYLGLEGAGINDAQEVALVTLHAAVRVYILDAHDELEMVERWAAETRRDELGARSESRDGEQGESSGNRRVQAVGGAA